MSKRTGPPTHYTDRTVEIRAMKLPVHSCAGVNAKEDEEVIESADIYSVCTALCTVHVCHFMAYLLCFLNAPTKHLQLIVKYLAGNKFHKPTYSKDGFILLYHAQIH